MNNPRMDEPTFYEELFERSPRRVYQCHQCRGPYFSITYHLLYKCSTEKAPHLAPVVQRTTENLLQSDSPSGLTSESSAERSSLPQDESPAQVGKSIPEKRAPHWWHWVRAATPREVVGADGKTYQVARKIQEPYTPHPVVRRRAVPSIACALYYQAWALYATKQSAENALPGYVETSRRFYEADKAKADKLIELLVFCEVPRQFAVGLALEAYRDAEEGLYKHWSDSPRGKGIGRGMLALIGYQLAEGEPDGHFDSHGASYAHVAQAEGVKGR